MAGRSSLTSKKGQSEFGYFYVIIILIVLFGLAYGSLLIYKIFGEWNTDIQSDDTLSDENKAIVTSTYNRYPTVLDGIFIFVLVGVWLFTIVAAFMAPNHPVLFVVAILLSIIVLVLGMNFANIYDDTFNQDTELQTTAASFPMTNYVMTHLMTIILVFIATAAVAMYAGNRYAE